MIAASFFGYKAFWQEPDEGSNAEDDDTQADAPTVSGSTTAIYAKIGQRGQAVRELQAYLNAKGQRIAIDGIFGQQTQGAVRAVFGTNDVTVNQWQRRG